MTGLLPPSGTHRIENERKETDKTAKLKRHLFPVGSLLLVLGIMAVLFIFRERMATLGDWGYLGAFFIGLIANATVFLPMPGLLLLAVLSISFNPVGVALAGAAGGALGEMGGYALGYGGRSFVGDRRLFQKAGEWMKRAGMATVFVFAVFPFLPCDIAGITAGATRFPVWKFLTSCFAGKFTLYLILTLASARGWQFIQKLIS